MVQKKLPYLYQYQPWLLLIQTRLLKILSRPKAPKIFQELLSNSEELKRFQRIPTAQVLGQPKDSNCLSTKPTKGFQGIPKEFKIPNDSIGFHILKSWAD